MQFTDKEIRCRCCREYFVFSAGEQKFFHDQHFEHAPQTCPNCRRCGSRPRVDWEGPCANCEQTTRVPFKPVQGRPVYCRECFDLLRREATRPLAA